jgi:hypothetical protein
MPSMEDILKDHEHKLYDKSGTRKIERKGPSRPWQEKQSETPTAQVSVIDTKNKGHDLQEQKKFEEKTNAQQKAVKIKNIQLSESAEKLRALISNLGYELAMKYLLLKEVADPSTGTFSMSQLDLSQVMRLSKTSMKRLIEDLSEANLIKIEKEFDSKDKLPKTYKIL